MMNRRTLPLALLIGALTIWRPQMILYWIIGVLMGVLIGVGASRLQKSKLIVSELIAENTRLFNTMDDQHKTIRDLKHELYCVRQHLPSQIRHLSVHELIRL